MVEHKQSPQATKDPAEPFHTLDQLVAAAVKLLAHRSNWKLLGGRSEAKSSRAFMKRVRDARTQFHKRVMASSHLLRFCQLCRENELDALEVEILVALTLSQMGILRRELTTPEDICDDLEYGPADRFDLLHKLCESGRLYRQGILCRSNSESFTYQNRRHCPTEPQGFELRDTVFRPAPEVYRYLMRESKTDVRTVPVKSLDDLRAHLRDYIRHASERASLASDLLDGDPVVADLKQQTERFCDMHKRIRTCLQEHPDWPLARLIEHAESDEEEVVLLILAGKAMGLLRCDHDVFTSGTISHAACLDEEYLPEELECIEQEGRLRTAGLIRSTGMHTEEHPFDRSEGEVLELTSKALDILGAKRRRAKSPRKATGSILTPRLSMDGIVVPDDVREQLQMAVAQARYSPVLMEAWGMKRRFPYGTGATLLLSGPPGVGKTACAEALAHELGKKVMTIDYAKVQGPFVSETERNIADAFREAKEAGAVLFWDEADTLLTSRDHAVRRWEVSQVNVLLQEIETFEGVCIFATNRKPALDSALERRITMKIELERPDRSARRHLWQTLLPNELPVAPDVDLDNLAEHDLTGGEIKNVILNAARRALLRSPEGPVTMADFDQALRMEIDGRFSGKAPVCMGFHSASKRDAC